CLIVGRTRARSSRLPRRTGSLSSWAASMLASAPCVKRKVGGQYSKASTQAVPAFEATLNGSHDDHVPLGPSKCNQQLVTRNGGNTRATTAKSISNFCPRCFEQ